MNARTEKSALHLVRIQRIEPGSRAGKIMTHSTVSPFLSFWEPPFLLIVLLNEAPSVLELPGTV